MALTLIERETIINYNDGDSEANIYTVSPVVKKRLEKLGEVHECNGGWELNVPKSWVTVKPPRKLSEAQKESARKALAKARSRNAV